MHKSFTIEGDLHDHEQIKSLRSGGIPAIKSPRESCSESVEHDHFEQWVDQSKPCTAPGERPGADFS